MRSVLTTVDLSCYQSTVYIVLIGILARRWCSPPGELWVAPSAVLQVWDEGRVDGVERDIEGSARHCREGVCGVGELTSYQSFTLLLSRLMHRCCPGFSTFRLEIALLHSLCLSFPCSTSALYAFSSPCRSVPVSHVTVLC